MGGAMEMVNSALDVVGSVAGQSKGGSQTSGQYELLKAEREAQAEEQRKQEAEDRKRTRERITEAREKEKRRLATQTTLINGGLLVESDTKSSSAQLKDKFGE